MFKHLKFLRYSKEFSVKLSILFFIITFVFISFTAPSHADITRGCAASFSINVHNVKGTQTNKHTKLFDKFEARGACKNKAQANTCRKRAKDNVFRCANELWDSRWNLIGDPNDNNADLGLPSICTGRSTGAKGIGPYRKNQFGQVFDIKNEIEYQACCVLQPKADSLDIKLTVHSQGDNGCGAYRDPLPKSPWGETRTLIGDYHANCKQLRVRRLCGGIRTGG